MSRSSRRDGDRRENGRRQDESQERQPAAETPERQHAGESGGAEGDSLTALKAILGKVAALLKPLQLTPDESIQLVEQLYGRVLEMDLELAGEADETRKTSVLEHIQNTNIRREGDRLVVEYPK